MKSIFHMGNIH